MKKLIVILIIIIISAFTFLSFSTREIILNEDGYYVSEYAYMHKDEWASVNWDNSIYASPVDYLTHVDSLVEDISSYLEEDDWLRENVSDKEGYENLIEMKFHNNNSQASGGRYDEGQAYIPPVVNINIKRAENNVLNVAHELTHVLAPYALSKTLSEGLACHIQDTFTPESPSFISDANHIVSETLKDGQYIIDYLGSTENGKNKLYASDRNELLMYYAYSQSFSEYIIETYGLKTFMTFYQSECKAQDYMTLFNMTRDELIATWLDHLDLRKD